jgi:hypothetical protein
MLISGGAQRFYLFLVLYDYAVIINAEKNTDSSVGTVITVRDRKPRNWELLPGRSRSKEIFPSKNRPDLPRVPPKLL